MGTSLENRQRLLAGLDSVERVVTGVYRLFLGLLILGILGGAAFVIIRRPWGAGHQGEWFYFTIAVLLALGWAVGQYVGVVRRQRRRHWELPVTLRTHHDDDVQGWELRFGSSSDAGTGLEDAGSGTHVDLSAGFQLPIASLARDVLPDADAVARLQAELAAGVDLDEACRTVQPAYAGWNALARWAYRKYATGLLQQQHWDTTRNEGDG